LRFATEDLVSLPDGNTIKVQVIRPDTDETLACVYYIHGGGMASMSSFDGTTRVGEDHRVERRRRRDGRIPQRGRAVEVLDVAPFPAGLNDCMPVSSGPWRTRRNTESTSENNRRR